MPSGADYSSLDLTTTGTEVVYSETTTDSDGNDVITYYSTSYMNHLDCTGSIDYVYTCYKF